jgi:serine/threonine protein kinase/TolB-like protein
MDPTWSPERWRAVQTHFERLLDLAPGEREAWLAGVRAENPELADDLATLLADHRALEQERFLETPPPAPPLSGTLAGQTLGAYTLLSQIGQGGMGTVWLAKRSDGRFEGMAAVKLLNASFIGRAAEERFQREGSILARLQHPHIAHLLDAGVSPAGQPYLILEYVEGEPIDRYCDRKNLDIAERSALFLDVLKAVAHAHAHHVVHRDIKPSNVLVGADGQVKLLDFGIAKLLEGDAADGEATALTREAGRALTPEYAAPEQISGGTITPATDVYSLGVLLYEVLVGVHPLDTRRLREAGWAEIDRIIREEEPVPPSTRVARLGDSAFEMAGRRRTDPAGLRRELAGELDWITLKALEKDPARRYAAAAELAADVDRHLRDEPVSAGRPDTAYRLKKLIRRRRVPLATAAAFIVALAALLLLERPGMGGREPSQVKRLVVLPFENLGAPEDDYFADGIADAVRGKLTLLPGVQVIARGSSTPYKRTTKTPRQIARELDVGYLLTATVRWQKGTTGTSRVQVSPELVEIPASGAPTAKWQQPFDAALTDVFQVQSNIATRVARELNIALGAGEEKRLLERPTQNLAAYDAYLKGEDTSNSLASDTPSVRKALYFYEQAVALDPGFVEAWVQASQANSILYYFGGATPELAEGARRAAEKAASLAPDRAEGYRALGTYLRLVVGDHVRALEEYAKGQRVAPGDARLVRGTALAEMGLGRWEASVEHLRQAGRLDPRSVRNAQSLAQALRSLRRYAEARETCDRGLALSPANLGLIREKVVTFLGEGNLASASAAVKAALEDVEPTPLLAYMASGDLEWVLDREERDVLLRLAPSAFVEKGVWGMSLARAAALNGRTASARVYAEEARKAFAAQLRALPDDAPLLAELALALAYLGRKEEAVLHGERSVAMLPSTKDAVVGPYLQHRLVQIYTLVGEPEKAIDTLEPLLKFPYELSPAWLSIDPNFDPLRKNPRFQRLVAGGTSDAQREGLRPRTPSV